MPKYYYKAKSKDNKKVSGVFFAHNEEDLRKIINNQNYFLISSKKIAESSGVFNFLERISVDDLTIFCRQFAIMVTTGITIVKSIETLKNNTKNQKLKNILEEIHVDLLKGKLLHESFAKYPRTFPNFFRNMIYIGEVSGKLDIVLPRIADYYENDSRIRKKVKSALTYPIFLLSLVVIVIGLLSFFIIPIFTELFANFETELPAITKIVIGFSNFLKMNYGFIFLSIVFFIAFICLFKRSSKGEMTIDKLKLRFPMTRKILIAQITSQFASGFSTLLGSGIQVVDAIDIMGKLLGNKAVELKFTVAINEVKRGQGIAKSIETINLFPDMLIQMLEVGEQTAELEQVLNKTAGYFEEEVSVTIKKMTSALEPALIMFIALIVVFVILSVFIPMLDLMNSIDQIGT